MYTLFDLVQVELHNSMQEANRQA